MIISKIRDGLFKDSLGNEYGVLQQSMTPQRAISVQGNRYFVEEIKEVEDAVIVSGDEAGGTKSEKDDGDDLEVVSFSQKTLRSSIRKKVSCLRRKLLRRVSRSKHQTTLQIPLSSRRIRTAAETRTALARHDLCRENSKNRGYA